MPCPYPHPCPLVVASAAAGRGAAGGAWATGDGAADDVAVALTEIRAGSRPLMTVAVVVVPPRDAGATRCPRSAAGDWHWAVAVVVDPRPPASCPAAAVAAAHWAPRSCSTGAH